MVTFEQIPEGRQEPPCPRNSGEKKAEKHSDKVQRPMQVAGVPGIARRPAMGQGAMYLRGL